MIAAAMSEALRGALLGAVGAFLATALASPPLARGLRSRLAPSARPR
jgi:hypothetical protein